MPSQVIQLALEMLRVAGTPRNEAFLESANNNNVEVEQNNSAAVIDRSTVLSAVEAFLRFCAPLKRSERWGMDTHAYPWKDIKSA
jgi:hypothetical protein